MRNSRWKEKQRNGFKNWAIPLVLALCCAGSGAFAESDSPDLYVNGAWVQSAEDLFVEGGRTMVPLRTVSNMLDLDVQWVQKTSTAVLKDQSGNVFEITLGKKTAYKNKKPMQMDAAAMMRHSRIYVPLKFIATGFSHTVDYDAENRSVIIDGNYVKPLNRGYQVYRYGTGVAPEVIAEAKSAPFQSVAVAMKNSVLRKGIRFRTGGAFLKTDPKEYLEIRQNSKGLAPKFVIRLHSKGEEVQLDGQIEEEFYEGLSDGFLQAVIFDLGADKENDLLLIAGDESGFRMLPFAIGMAENEKGEIYGMIYPLFLEDGKYVQGEFANFYDQNGNVRIYEGNGGAYRILSKDPDGNLALSDLKWE